NRAGRVMRVPLSAAERVGQQLICLVDVVEAPRVARRAIRVVALGQRSMSGLDLGLGRAARDTQHAVRIERVGHQASSDSGASSNDGTLSPTSEPRGS